MIWGCLGWAEMGGTGGYRSLNSTTGTDFISGDDSEKL